MTRILARIVFAYLICGILRAVERRFGVVGVLAVAGFVFLLPLALRAL